LEDDDEEVDEDLAHLQRNGNKHDDVSNKNQRKLSEEKNTKNQINVGDIKGENRKSSDDNKNQKNKTLVQNNEQRKKFR